MEERRIDWLPIDELVRYPKNPKRHALDAIGDSVQAVGFVTELRLNETTGRLLEGHGRLDYLLAQKKAGKEPPEGIRKKGGKWLAPVVRGIALTEAQEDRFVVAANRLVELGGWDDKLLADLLSEVADAEGGLLGTGYDAETLGDLLLSVAPPKEQQDPEPQVDRAAELQAEWKTERGQVWQVGAHRVLCGDMQEELAKLKANSVDMIFTDPPYGHRNNDRDLIANWEAALGRGKSGPSRPIVNDGPEANDLVRTMYAESSRLLKPGCCCCCCCGGGGGPDPQFARWSLWLDELLGFKMCVVWDKGGLGMGWHYRRCWECILVGEKPGAATHWFGGNDVPNVVRDIGKIIPSADQHPTEKPVALVEWFVKLHSAKGELVLDPFLGSGTTLVACENLGRVGYGCELEPKYVAVTLQRLADMGLTPKLLQ